MKFSGIFTFLAFCNVGWSIHSRRSRDEHGLAPEINGNHPHRMRSSEDSLKYAVGFRYFEEDGFSEFIVQKIENFDLVHVEIPISMAEDVLVDIRSKSYVEGVENILKLHSHNIYWNKARVGLRTHSEFMIKGNSNQREIIGIGHDVYIYVIDSGVDDHVEFGNRIVRQDSMGFGNRKSGSVYSSEDSYDCRGHGTFVAGIAAGKHSGVAPGARIISFSVMDCQTGTTTSDVIHLALNEVYEQMLQHPDRKVVVNLSNGLSSVGETDISIQVAEEKIKNLGGIVVRAS
eukprot:Awhi_evm1s4736